MLFGEQQGPHYGTGQTCGPTKECGDQHD